jgi:hypothetical protein
MTLGDFNGNEESEQSSTENNTGGPTGGEEVISTLETLVKSRLSNLHEDDSTSFLCLDDKVVCDEEELVEEMLFISGVVVDTVCE